MLRPLRGLAVLGHNDVYTGAADIRHHDIADLKGRLRADFVDLLHAPEDLVLGDISLSLDAGPLFCAAYDHDCGCDSALRMGHFPAGIFVADRAGIALDAEDLLALKLDRDLAAHGAADTSKIPLFHLSSMSKRSARRHPRRKPRMRFLRWDPQGLRLFGSNLGIE